MNIYKKLLFKRWKVAGYNAMQKKKESGQDYMYMEISCREFIKYKNLYQLIKYVKYLKNKGEKINDQRV